MLYKPCSGRLGHQILQVVILDNASTDETSKLMNAWVKKDSRVKYIKNPRNLGMIGNFNQIRGHISSDYFCVLTDDDVYEPIFLQTALELFCRFPSSGFVGTNAPIRKGGIVTKTMIEDWEEGFHPKGSKILQCARSQHPLFTHCLFKSELAEEFVFYESVETVSDGFLLTCLATKYDMAISKVITGYWDLHGQNMTMLQVKNPKRYIDCLVALGKLYQSYCDRNALVNRLKYFHFTRICVGLLDVGRNRNIFIQEISRGDVKLVVGPWAIVTLKALRAIQFLDMALAVKKLLRKLALNA